MENFNFIFKILMEHFLMENFNGAFNGAFTYITTEPKELFPSWDIQLKKKN